MLIEIRPYDTNHFRSHPLALITDVIRKNNTYQIPR